MMTPRMTHAERVATLGGCRSFANLGADGVALLAEMVESERYPAGAVVCEEGEPAHGMFVVAAGRLAVRVGDAPAGELGPGEIVGEYGLFTSVRLATVRAETDAVLLGLDYERFRALLLRYPEVCLALLETAVRRLVAAQRRGRP
jgi:voltage-gated potassium channel